MGFNSAFKGLKKCKERDELVIDYIWVRDLTAPMHLGLLNRPFVPDELVKCAFLKEILYLFIRMVTKKTLVIIAYHVPTL
jgi:hypothetical protein